MRMITILSVMLLGIVAMQMVSAAEINSQVSTYQTERTMDKIEELQNKVATNKANVENLMKGQDRLYGLLERIFLIILTSVISAIAGGFGIGYSYGKRKN